MPFSNVPFRGLSQNFGAIILATYFGMPNFGNKNGKLFFGMPNFGNLTLARKMATYFGIPNFGNLTLVSNL